ncbi:MAG: oligoribonuclease [Burkholderiaceae bacterium]|jgi:oligoribonuclease
MNKIMSQAMPSTTLSSEFAEKTPIVRDETRLIWIDMEMTGLDPVNDKIIELAAVITDSQLQLVAEGPVLVVHQPDEILAGMDKWNQSTHGKSGLIDKVRTSVLDEAAAEAQMLAFLSQYLPVGKSPMCGNSICQDRRFMGRYMPRLEKFFHYRNLDVSTLKELCKRWQPAIAKGFHKKSQHTALADIYESIDELIYYRTHFIRAESVSAATPSSPPDQTSGS